LTLKAARRYTRDVTPPVALTIAGSDSGGGAGIQADLRTFAALGVFGTTAITAVTAQNTYEVRAFHAMPPQLVVAQALAVLDDLPVAAVKTGMLADAGIVDAVAALASEGRLPNLVVDPVLVASSGAVLASPAAIAAYLDRLIPLAKVVTPNLAEAGVLLNTQLRTLAEQRDAARRLGEATPAVVVIKGGHPVVDVDGVVDVVWDGQHLYETYRPRIATINTHGSGCSFAAATAVFLASTGDPIEATAAAGDFVHRAIVTSADWRIGAGHGPLDHFGWGTQE
jgi:hydroxymethylpyrimidine/phosphomethylpyrimidine kinase